MTGGDADGPWPELPAQESMEVRARDSFASAVSNEEFLDVEEPRYTTTMFFSSKRGIVH